MFENRLKTLLAFLVLVCAVLMLRAFQLQVVQKSDWDAEAERSMRTENLIDTTRGRILDRKGRVLAEDSPCIDACVDYRAIDPNSDKDWLKRISRARLRARVSGFDGLSITQRSKLLVEESEAVKGDIKSMWHTLAKMSHRTDEEMLEARTEILLKVETTRRLVQYHKHQQAQGERDAQKDQSKWVDWILGGSQGDLDIDDFNVQTDEQLVPHIILANIDPDTRIALQKQIDHMPGLVLQESVVRRYPYNETACHVIGQMGKVAPKDLLNDPNLENALRKYRPTDEVGRSGLEAMCEQQLRGTRGQKTLGTGDQEIDHHDPVGGHDVRTTIDAELQAQIEEAFRAVSFKPFANAAVDQLPMLGAAVAIDIRTNEVLAMVSVPNFDLNKFDDEYAKLSKDLINRPLMNRATQMALEPGSSVKPMVGIGAMSSGLLGEDETILCTGYLVLNGHKYPYGRCWTMSQFGHGLHVNPYSAPHPNGHLNFPDGLERSCNVFFETLGDRLGIVGLSDWFSRFGLGRPTGVGIEEVSGRLPNSFKGPVSRQRGIAWFAAIGQGQIAATPIQMANVAATISRKGLWMRPTLLPRNPQDLRPGSPDVAALPVSATAMRQAQQGMFNVVNGRAGTGTDAHMDEFGVCGKTGSAQSAPLRVASFDDQGRFVKNAEGKIVYNPLVIGTHETPNPIAPWYRGIGDGEQKVAAHAWMIGFAPADHPKIAYAVLVEYGGTGGTAAGSVVKKLLEACVDQGYLP